MIRLTQEGAYVLNGALVVEEGEIHDGDRFEARCRELNLPVPGTDRFAKESAKKRTIAREYATKRYRSNCINWGLLPLISASEITDLSLDSFIFLPDIRNAVESGREAVDGWLINGDKVRPLSLSMPDLTEKDREVLLAGNLINYHSADK